MAPSMFYEMNQAIEKEKPAQFLIEVGIMLLNDGILLSDLLIVLKGKLSICSNALYAKEIMTTLNFFSSKSTEPSQI
jgi:hypothetical protein